MVVVANIDLWGQFAGAVLLDQATGVSSFEFNPGFLRNNLDIAPAYDMSYAFKSSHRYLSQHQLSVNNKRIGVSRDDLISVAEQMNIKKPKEIIGQICDVFSKWPKYASGAGMPEKQILSIGKAHLIKI
jgi:serine/threonine-protein kinase HipA